MARSASPLARWRDRDHTRGSLLTSILVLSLPSVLTSAAGFGLFQTVDLYILGKLGPAAVAAAGATNQVVRQVIFLTIMGITVSAQMMIARLVGMRNVEGAEHVAGQVVLLGLAVAMLAAVGGGLFPRTLIGLLASDPAVIAHGQIYLQITLLTMATTIGFQLLSSVLTGAGDTTTPLIVTLLTTPISIAAEWTLAFGSFGFPPLGVAGVALGAALGSAVGAGVLLWAIGSGRCRVHLLPRHFLPDLAMMRLVLATSWQPALQMVARTSIIMVFMILAGRLGGEVQAAYTIGLRLEMLLIAVAFPIANACATLVGQNLGAGDLPRSWRSVWAGFGVEVSVLWPGAIFLFLFRSDLASFFTESPAVAALAAEYLAYSSAILVFYGLYFVAFRTLQAAGDMTPPMVISISCALLLGAPIGYFLATRSDLGATGMWIGNLVYALVNSLLTVAWLLTGRWARRRSPFGGPFRADQDTASEAGAWSSPAAPDPEVARGRE